jgi:hypothetical protein
MSRPFKNALCGEPTPERGYSHPDPRHGYCQRKAGHKGPYRSWSWEWNDGDNESKWRGEAKA